jgi:hypothetical protein
MPGRRPGISLRNPGERYQLPLRELTVPSSVACPPERVAKGGA